jgi:hypothetical protein
LAGMAVTQAIDLGPFRSILTTLTMICLSYIMIEVSLAFSLNKSRVTGGKSGRGIY